jgi:hypothetical protein
MPNAGKRKSGAMDATPSGTASVIHHRNTHASTPSMLRAAGCPPRSPPSTQSSAHASGPDATARYLLARTDQSAEHERPAPAGRLSSSCTGSSGLVTSSVELSQQARRGSMAAENSSETNRAYALLPVPFDRLLS